MRDNLPNMLRAAANEWRGKNKVVATGATRYDFALEEAADAIEELSSSAVRPVVLCKDCVYLTRDAYGAWCFNNYEESLKDDDFCSHGKRKEKS